MKFRRGGLHVAWTDCGPHTQVSDIVSIGNVLRKIRNWNDNLKSLWMLCSTQAHIIEEAAVESQMVAESLIEANREAKLARQMGRETQVGGQMRSGRC